MATVQGLEVNIEQAIASVRKNGWRNNANAIRIVTQYVASHQNTQDSADMFRARMSDDYNTTVREYCDVASRILRRNS